MKKLFEIAPEAGGSKLQFVGLASPVEDNTAILIVNEVVGGNVINKEVKSRCWTCDELLFDENNYIVSDHRLSNATQANKRGAFLVMPGGRLDTTGLGIG